MPNPYSSWVADGARHFDEGRALPLGGVPPLALPTPAASAPKVLLFSPHPDDECITGGLPLRLRRDLRWNVINVAVTQGSKKERQAARLDELRQACEFLGFGLVTTRPGGLEHINTKGRDAQPAQWRDAVAIIARILAEHMPAVVILPHDQDWNSTHIGTHHLVADALRQMPDHFTCHTVETEFWGALADPNLMVASSVADVATLVAAISFHAGEVARNPYHLRLPAWLMDNVRRGGELVGGQGGAAPDVSFATLYRLRRYARGRFHFALEAGRIVGVDDDLAALFCTTE
jgi:LmbE family N-acetylglucosaminyl deacetylase